MKTHHKILVTGGSGYIGSVVVRDLLSRGYEIIVFDNLERGHRCNVPSGVKLVVGDLKNASEIMSAVSVAKPDAVLHFAAYALVGESMQEPGKYFLNNISGGVNLLEAMRQIGCKRIIFSSSCATYGIPIGLPIEEEMPQVPTNPYGYTKLVFEQMCHWASKVYGLEATFLRYFNAAGAAYGMVEDHEPETHIIPNVLRVALGKQACVRIYGDDYPTRDGTCIRDYVHLKDLSSAHILALEKGAQGAFNLGVGDGVSVKDIVDSCRRITGRPIPVEVCHRRLGDPPELYASGAKARRELGWNPQYSDIDTIIRDAWQAHVQFPDGYCENC